MKVKPGADVPSDFNTLINKSASQTSDVSTPAARDFASVLDQVSRPQRHDEEGAQDQTGPGLENLSLRQPSLEVEAPAARAILQTADLDKIVVTVRTQLAPGGHREVILQLPHSVLEGLQVKLSAGEAGRVTAEFLAPSERVKAQLDARAGELSDLLRARGVELAKLSTSISAEASGLADSGDRRRPDGRAEVGPARRAGRPSPAADESQVGEAGDEIAPPSDKVYRA